MPQYVLPWVDGEKIPDDRLRDIFRAPPGVPSAFLRSSLVIGSRGVGKTTLLRHLKEEHIGSAVHIALVTEFASLAKQTNLGPLGYEYPATFTPLVVGKATTLLALSICERLARKSVRAPAEALRVCLPDGLLTKIKISDPRWYESAKSAVARAPLEAFGGISQSRPLADLLSCLGKSSEPVRGPLLLVFDRADTVPAAFLGPVIELLDQSANYVALVATRPGHAGRTIAEATPGAAPGDHYAIVYLGTNPYVEGS